MAGRRVTARDVAREAGVSQSTVSYVLNDTPHQSIPPATRARVRDAAAALGYTPSAAARALRRGASEAVLMVLPDAPIGESIAQAIEGVAEVLEPHGYAVVHRRQKEGRPLASLWRELMPAAIATLSALPADEAVLMEAAGIPVVASSLDPGHAGDVVTPQRAIGRLQVRHLAERGHRTVGFAASTDPHVQQFLAPRLTGVRHECAERGLPAPVVVDVPWDREGAVGAVRRLRDRPEPVTAVAAYNDDLAFAVLAGMRTHGLRAPDDVAVIGVDNIPLAQFAVPPLTTVDSHSEDVGRDIGRLVLQRLRPELVLEPPVAAPLRVVVRSTT